MYAYTEQNEETEDETGNGGVTTNDESVKLRWSEKVKVRTEH